MDPDETEPRRWARLVNKAWRRAAVGRSWEVKPLFPQLQQARSGSSERGGH